MKILIIEDDPDVGLMVKSALGRLDVEVEVIGHDFEHELKSVARLADFDAIVVDILLGESYTGIDLLEWVKLHVPGVKLISYSAVITLNPRLRELADVCVLKGDLHDLFRALDLE